MAFIGIANSGHCGPNFVSKVKVFGIKLRAFFQPIPIVNGCRLSAHTGPALEIPPQQFSALQTQWAQFLMSHSHHQVNCQPLANSKAIAAKN
jgi:hypothetical protein